MSGEIEIIKDAIDRQFGAYLRMSRCGGMPPEVSESLEEAFRHFSEIDLQDAIAEGLRAARHARGSERAGPATFGADGICIQCNAGPDEGCKRDHREPTCWMEERATDEDED